MVMSGVPLPSMSPSIVMPSVVIASCCPWSGTACRRQAGRERDGVGRRSRRCALASASASRSDRPAPSARLGREVAAVVRLVVERR